VRAAFVNILPTAIANYQTPRTWQEREYPMPTPTWTCLPCICRCQPTMIACIREWCIGYSVVGMVVVVAVPKLTCERMVSKSTMAEGGGGGGARTGYLAMFV
jgi:hypothetical protein